MELNPERQEVKRKAEEIIKARIARKAIEETEK